MGSRRQRTCNTAKALYITRVRDTLSHTNDIPCYCVWDNCQPDGRQALKSLRSTLDMLSSLHSIQPSLMHLKDTYIYMYMYVSRMLTSNDLQKDIYMYIVYICMYVYRRGYGQCTLISILQVQGRVSNDTSEEYRTPLAVTYHPSLPPLTRITQKHHSLLDLSDTLQKTFQTPPNVAFQCPKNLRDLLLRADLSFPACTCTSLGKSSSGRIKCKTCLTMLSTNTFSSKTTG